MKLLLSSYSLEPFPLEETFLLAKELKTDGLELVLTPLVYKTGLEKVKDLSQKHNLPVMNIHQAPWGVLFTGRRGIMKLVSQARYLGCANAVVHLATMRRRFKSPFFKWIKELERESGIAIAFENGAPRFLEKRPRYSLVPELLSKFIKSRNINLTLDVSKLFMAGEDPYQFFKQNRDNIKAMHLHGFDHDSYHIGFDGHNFDWSGFASFVKKYSYEGAVTLEIFPMHKWVRFNMPPLEKLEETKEILRDNFEVLRRV